MFRYHDFDYADLFSERASLQRIIDEAASCQCCDPFCQCAQTIDRAEIKLEAIRRELARRSCVGSDVA